MTERSSQENCNKVSVFSIRKNSQSKNTSLLRKQSDPKNENLNNYTEAIFPSAQDKRTNYITRK